MGLTKVHLQFHYGRNRHSSGGYVGRRYNHITHNTHVYEQEERRGGGGGFETACGYRWTWDLRQPSAAELGSYGTSCVWVRLPHGTDLPREEKRGNTKNSCHQRCAAGAGNRLRGNPRRVSGVQGREGQNNQKKKKKWRGDWLTECGATVDFAHVNKR